MQDRIAELREYAQDHDAEFRRSFDFDVEEVRDSNNEVPGSYTIKGHAAVYNKWSLNLGGFREKIKPGAFDSVLAQNPHVVHVIDHDTSRVLSSTRSKKFNLELKNDNKGLGFFSRVAPTTYASDLRTLLDSKVVDQSSFAFTVAKDEWKFIEDDEGERVERTILEVDQLFDVTTCAMGAYPQTDSSVALRSLANKVSRTLERGAEGEEAAPDGEAAPAEVDASSDEPAAPEEDGDATASEDGSLDEADPVAAMANREELKALKRRAADDVQAALRRFHRRKESDQ